MIDPFLYQPIILYSTIILTLFSLKGIQQQSFAAIYKGKHNTIIAFIIAILGAWFIGQRPDPNAFGDSFVYAHTFKLLQQNLSTSNVESSEWLWARLMYWISTFSNISTFFTIVAFGYFLFAFWACKRLTPNNVLISFLFVMGAFSFYTYSVNGLRSGLACAMVLACFGCINGSWLYRIIGFLLAFCAFAIHNSTLLPISMALISLFLIKNFKIAYSFWIASIVISLMAGGLLSNFIAGLGFDNRLSYITNQNDAQYTNNSFRFDFLIYSMMPILLGYYVIIKKGVKDKSYLFLLNTYTLSNAVWVIVIRAAYSNRFAYLSWFMYPIVLAYPLLRLDIWGKQQGKYLQRIMLAQIGFTWFMSTIYS